LTNLALSRFEKVQAVIQKSFPLIWFSSKDIQLAYEQELKEPISLSTVSTYLSRMTGKGWLLRTGGSNNLKYKTVSSISQATIKQSIK
jgi:predicted transcriptional regulator